MLKFDDHVTEICIAASKQLAFFFFFFFFFLNLTVSNMKDNQVLQSDLESLQHLGENLGYGELGVS